MMNKEFQHCVESQLIEVMNMKMLSIQFVLIANLIRMQSSEIENPVDTIPPSPSQSNQGPMRAKRTQVLACIASGLR
jgi:hypothetical protein